MVVLNVPHLLRACTLVIAMGRHCVVNDVPDPVTNPRGACRGPGPPL